MLTTWPSLATGAPPRRWRGRSARSAGTRQAVTVTTGPTHVSHVGLSSGGQFEILAVPIQLDISNKYIPFLNYITVIKPFGFMRSHKELYHCPIVFRCVQRQTYHKLICKTGHHCHIDAKTRKKCMACRWKSCIMAGEINLKYEQLTIKEEMESHHGRQV